MMHIIQGNQVVQCDENRLKRTPIQKAEHLLREEWIMIYQNPQEPNQRKRSNY